MARASSRVLGPSPWTIATVYAGDECGCRIQKFTNRHVPDPMGRGRWRRGIRVASGIAADHQGHVYVVDVVNDDPEVHDRRQASVHVGNSRDKSGCGSDSGLYVVDGSGPGGQRRQRRRVEAVGSSGHGHRQFVDPSPWRSAVPGMCSSRTPMMAGSKVGMATRWLITGAAGPDSSIRPAGECTSQGHEPVLLHVPNLGYRVSGVLVDGTRLDARRVHVHDVTADHTIDAGFTVLEGWPNDALLNPRYASALNRTATVDRLGRREWCVPRVERAPRQGRRNHVRGPRPAHRRSWRAAVARRAKCRLRAAALGRSLRRISRRR